MADTSGEADIRGIDIDKLAKGFADEDIIFKKFVTVTNTSAREIRWYQKTAGIITATSPEATANVDELALPTILEQSWTRQTSYVRKYIVDSPVLSDEDIKDSDIDILATNIRDLTRNIARQVDTRIWDVMTESRVPSAINWASVSGSWSGGGGDPIYDILGGKQEIRAQGYNPEGATMFLNSISQKNLLLYLISTKGASIPQFSSQRVVDGVVMELLGLNVIVSENVTANYGAIAQGKRALTWKSFTPITAVTIKDPGLGTKIRVWEEGEALLTDGGAVFLISGTGIV